METNASTPNLNPTPKARFRESGNNVSEHRALIESKPFTRAADFALLEYQAQLGMIVSQNPQEAAFAGLKMTGAQEFLQTFRTLSEQPRVASRVVLDNLNHKA